jgi:four helix bundle protein
MGSIWLGFRCTSHHFPNRLRTTCRRRTSLEYLGRKCEGEAISEGTGEGLGEGNIKKKRKKISQTLNSYSFMEKKYNDFRDMGVWQKSFLLLIDIYSIIKKFPADERFALTDQLKRAANSVVHNLAEGYGRYESKDKTRFYKISRGSAFESMSQILVAESQNYLSTETSENIIERYKKVIEEINALIHHLEK